MSDDLGLDPQVARSGFIVLAFDADGDHSLCCVSGIETAIDHAKKYERAGWRVHTIAAIVAQSGPKLDALLAQSSTA